LRRQVRRGLLRLDAANLPLDWENLADEIEGVGKSDRRGVVSQLERIIEYLLRLEFSPSEFPRRGWKVSVSDARREADLILADSLSLPGRLADLLPDVWRRGRAEAANGLKPDGLPSKMLPADCPYTADQLLDCGWWPTNRHGLD